MEHFCLNQSVCKSNVVFDTIMQLYLTYTRIWKEIESYGCKKAQKSRTEIANDLAFQNIWWIILWNLAISPYGHYLFVTAEKVFQQINSNFELNQCWIKSKIFGSFINRIKSKPLSFDSPWRRPWVSPINYCDNNDSSADEKRQCGQTISQEYGNISTISESFKNVNVPMFSIFARYNGELKCSKWRFWRHMAF